MDATGNTTTHANAAEQTDLVALVAKIAVAYLSNNQVAPEAISRVLTEIRSGLAAVTQPAPADQEKQEPAVPIRRSVTPEYIVCLEDGKKLKMLKRYLRTKHKMTPEEYRAKWGLPSDYPMVAPSYAARRSEFAKSIGLGRSRAAPEPVPPPKATRGRKRKPAA